MCCNVPGAGWVSFTIYRQLEKYSTEKTRASRNDRTKGSEYHHKYIWKGVKGVIHCHCWGRSGGNLGKHCRMTKLEEWVQHRYFYGINKTTHHSNPIILLQILFQYKVAVSRLQKVIDECLLFAVSVCKQDILLFYVCTLTSLIQILV